MDRESPEITYYALIDDESPAEEASGLVRRVHVKPRHIDEAFGRDGQWHPTEYLDRYYLLGSMDQDHVEVSAEVAEQLLERWRAKWAAEETKE